jgi:hypothetical protein
MNFVKEAALHLILSALVLLSGCGQVVGKALGEAFSRTMIGMGFGQAYHHETGQWPQSVEQIRDYCVETKQGDICKLLDDYEQIRFEPNEVDPNTIDFEIVFAGGEMAGQTTKQDYPQEMTFKNIVQMYLTMGAGTVERTNDGNDPNCSRPQTQDSRRRTKD